MIRQILAVCIAALAFPAMAAPAAHLRLWRLDCGTIQISDLNEYSDTFAYTGQTKRLVGSCYLIKHGDTYMLWDTGLPEADLGLPLQGPVSTGDSLSRTIRDQLAEINVSPTSVSILGISHYHYDHTGQAASFPQAKLYIGREDIEALRKPGNDDAKSLEHWLSGVGKLEEVSKDKDIFHDGSVLMLDLPGHTPGHHGLLLKLAKTGYVLLSGDVAHFRENLETDGVPPFNYDRAKSLASLDRFKKISSNLKAVTIIQHEERDVAKLPKFPQSAE
jgi:N-acyl homoserine lactone hydrolase